MKQQILKCIIFFTLCTHYLLTNSKEIKIKILNKTNWINAEVMTTQEQKEQGLMGPRVLPKQHGMLFIYEQPDIHYFWMKDTFINLDILYFDSEKKYVGCLKNMQAGSRQPKTIKIKSQWVLEMNAGFCQQNQIDLGDKLIFFK